MKRHSHLFDFIATEQNFRLAFFKAAQGKRGRAEVREFAANLDARIRTCVEQLRRQVFPLGRFHQFTIYDPKQRIITAPCFEERVLHHAIMNVCEPMMDRFLISDTYACRVGKGREAAVLRARRFSQQFPFVAKLDVRKYFDSISHDRLTAALGRRFKDRRLIDLWVQIIDSYHKTPGLGVPIGSLTSQHLANLYLASADRHIKEALCVRGYIRYMDDMVLWHHSRNELRTLLDCCRSYMLDALGLECKQTEVRDSRWGFDFLGCRIFPSHLELGRRSKKRIRKGVQMVSRLLRLSLISERQAQQRCTSIMAFARAVETKSWRFRQAVLSWNSVDDP